MLDAHRPPSAPHLGCHGSPPASIPESWVRVRVSTRRRPPSRRAFTPRCARRARPPRVVVLRRARMARWPTGSTPSGSRTAGCAWRRADRRHRRRRRAGREGPRRCRAPGVPRLRLRRAGAWRRGTSRVDRLSVPRLRGVAVGWDAVLDDLAASLDRILAAGDPSAIGMYQATGMGFDAAGAAVDRAVAPVPAQPLVLLGRRRGQRARDGGGRARGREQLAQPHVEPVPSGACSCWSATTRWCRTATATRCPTRCGTCASSGRAVGAWVVDPRRTRAPAWPTSTWPSDRAATSRPGRRGP